VSLSPKVYRDFEILSAKSLHHLAEQIVRVFNFDFDHAFGFYSKLTGHVFDSPVKYELFADIGEGEARSVKRTRIVRAFPAVGVKMTFLFDYGDDWQFRIEATGQNRKERGGKYPRLPAMVQRIAPRFMSPAQPVNRVVSQAALLGSIRSMRASSLPIFCFATRMS
jgi:hypothetical protein